MIIGRAHEEPRKVGTQFEIRHGRCTIAAMVVILNGLS
jgi:hypothetical protein